MILSRTLILATLTAALASLSLGGCGKSDVGSRAVTALERAFRDGSVVEKMSDGEQLAFAHLSEKGFRKRGAHVFEGYGVQYRLVRVEAVDVVAEDLARKNDDGDTVQLIDDADLREKITGGTIDAVAEVVYEVVPSEKFLEDNAFTLIAQVQRLGPGDRTESFHLVRDSEGEWTIASGVFLGDLRRVLAVYRDEDNKLEDKLLTAELATRLLSKAPDQQE